MMLCRHLPLKDAAAKTDTKIAKPNARAMSSSVEVPRKQLPGAAITVSGMLQCQSLPH